MDERKFAVFDIDGTLFRWQLYHEIIFELIQGGHISAEAKAAIDQKLEDWRSRKHAHSFHDYEMTAVRAFASVLPRLSPSTLTAAADIILSRAGHHVYAYTRNLISELQGQGYALIAISGSQDEIVQRFAELWKFDLAFGQLYETKDDKYTGEIIGETLLVLQKGTLLRTVVRDHHLTWEGSIAVGDTASDASMLELVEHPIAFNPSDDLFATAQKHGWKIVIERKNMMYELEANNGTYLLAHAGTK